MHATNSSETSVTFNGLHAVISQKIAFLITSAVRVVLLVSRLGKENTVLWNVTQSLGYERVRVNTVMILRFQQRVKNVLTRWVIVSYLLEDRVAWSCVLPRNIMYQLL
jgi:hypothetical protein